MLFIVSTVEFLMAKIARSKIHCIVVTCRVAATLLSLGQTFHYRFKVPLFCDKDKNVAFSVHPTDILAIIIIKSAMIIWDEAPMGHR